MGEKGNMLAVNEVGALVWYIGSPLLIDIVELCMFTDPGVLIRFTLCVFSAAHLGDFYSIYRLHLIELGCISVLYLFTINKSYWSLCCKTEQTIIS